MKSIIFDLYGTLIYDPGYKETDIFPYVQFIRDLGGKNSNAIDRVLTENISLEKIKQEINPNSKIDVRGYQSLINEDIGRTICFADTIPTLVELSESYKLYCLSNVATPYKEPFYRFGLDRWLKPYFSCDIGFRKPDRKAFEIVVADSGMDSLMVGDSRTSDYFGAVDFGISAVLKEGNLVDTLKIAGIELN